MMTEASNKFRDRREWRLNLQRIAVVGCTAIAVGGCAAQKKAAIPWRTAVLVRPLLPEPTTESAAAANVPDIELEIPSPEPIALPRSGPARPRTTAPSTPRETQTGRLETPQIVPELSAQESSALQRETEQSLNDAERNVSAAAQRRLNDTQSDLASKVRSFIADARDAGKAGDWSRARDLAKKAQVLSEELARSL